MKFRSIGAVLIALMVFALPMYAQEQSGAIEGVVTDASGAVVPGATIEAHGSTGAVQTTTTDTQGVYHFASLPSGTYSLTANLTGFTAVKVPAIRLSLGQTLKVDMTVRVSTMQEEVTVTGEVPVVDVTSTVRSTSIRDEFVDLLPKGRDFTTLASQAPGANIEFKTGGISIDGATSSENKYVIDGIETNDPETGLSSQRLVTDMVDEVQVKSSGFEAEYSGAVGGVINVVTKSGTNAFKGAAWTYYSSDALGFARSPAFGGGGGVPGQAPAYADGRPSLRLSPSNSNVAEQIIYPKDDVTQWEPGFALGGPIKKDKAWFFVSYNPTLRSIDRTVTSTSGTVVSRNEDRKTHFISANLSAQATDAMRLRVAYNANTQTVKGLLPSLSGADSPRTNYDVTTKFPNWSSTASLDYVISPKFFMSARGGYFLQDNSTEGVFQGDKFNYINSNVGGCAGCPPVPSQFQGPTGFTNTLTNFDTIKNKYTRVSLQGDATWFLTAGGSHEIKGGVQYDRVKNSVLEGESGNLIRIYWGQSFRGQRGAFGYYRVRSNTFDPSRGFITGGDAQSNNLGLFLQDSWKIGNKLTVNLGLRTEHEKVPNYAPENPVSKEFNFGETLFDFPFKSKLAPRVGVAYDVRGDSKTKVFASWGLFYDIFKLGLPRGSFGGDKWTDVFYTLESPDPSNLFSCEVNKEGTTGVNCPGTQMTAPVDFRAPSFAYLDLDANGKPVLDPYRIQEWSGGIEHSLTSNTSLSLRYVHKQIDKGIEDIGFIDAQGNEQYLIGNPGFGKNTVNFVLTDGTIIPAPKAVRDYDSVEAIFNRRLADKWALRFSYLWSRLNGNYSGLTQADEPGRSDPNVGRLFDAPIIMFDQTGHATFGPLPTDRPHQVKMQFIYELPFGLSAGINGFVASGSPITREAAFVAGHNYPVQYLGRGSDGRTPWLSTFDVNLMYGIKMGGNKRLEFMANALNVLNSKTSTSRYPTETAQGTTVDITEDQFFRGFDGTALVNAAGPKDPRFLQDAQYQDPRQIRLGVRFAF
jgi:outer membrane receptor protein involved in Fe transport